MPDPTEREITRHINSASDSALKSLKEAQHRAPFINKIPNWPLKEKDENLLGLEIYQIAEQELRGFLTHFIVEKLDYTTVDLNRVMDWYDNSLAPFGAGKKRKEFPDAFVLAMIYKYIDKTNEDIAIISCDRDFEKASSSHENILYFESLAAYTEALLAEDSRIKAVHQLLENAENANKIIEYICITFPEVGFIIEDHWDGDVEDVTVEDVDFPDWNVIALGHKECTVAFVAEVNFTANISYDDMTTAVYDSSENFVMPIHKIEGSVSNASVINGIFRIKLNDSWDQFEKISFLEIYQDTITIYAEDYY